VKARETKLLLANALFKKVRECIGKLNEIQIICEKGAFNEPKM
jgi:hypothetical protein